MHANKHSESSLRTASDLFVTFLYAAAVHLVIAHFAQPQLNSSLARPLVSSSFLVLLFILFLFSDWIGRVRLPWLLPPEDEVGVSKQLLKTGLELTGLFFLVLACLTIIEIVTTGQHVVDEDAQAFWPLKHWARIWWGELSPYKAFAIFLTATFAWNLLMLLVMKRMKWRNLASMAFNGNALDSEQGRYYAKRFWQFRQDLEARVKAKTQPNFQEAGRFSRLASATFYADACVRMFAQLVAIHIAWTNVLAAIVIFTADTFFARKSVYTDVVTRLQLVDWPVFVDRSWGWWVSNLGTINVAAWVFHLIVVLYLAGKFFNFALSQWQEKKLRFIPLTTSALLASTLIIRGLSTRLFLAELVLIIIFGLPTIIFYTAAKVDEDRHPVKKKRRLQAAGIASAVLLLVLYLIAEPKLLVIIVAVQQVLINAFLQYAASDQSTDSESEVPAIAQG